MRAIPLTFRFLSQLNTWEMIPFITFFILAKDHITIGNLKKYFKFKLCRGDKEMKTTKQQQICTKTTIYLLADINNIKDRDYFRPLLFPLQQKLLGGVSSVNAVFLHRVSFVSNVLHSFPALLFSSDVLINTKQKQIKNQKPKIICWMTLKQV